MITTILWDNDGILVDTERLFFRATRETLAPLGVNLTQAMYIDYYLHGNPNPFQELVGGLASEAEIEQLRMARNQRYMALVRSQECVIDGVVEVLDALHGRVRMGVVTGAYRAHFDAIHESSNLLPYFDFVFTKEDYARNKPDPDAYLTALRGANLGASECIVVEDSERGLHSALGAGLKTIVVPHDLTAASSFEGAYKVLDSIAEVVPEILALASDDLDGTGD